MGADASADTTGDEKPQSPASRPTTPRLSSEVVTEAVTAAAVAAAAAVCSFVSLYSLCNERTEVYGSCLPHCAPLLQDPDWQLVVKALRSVMRCPRLSPHLASAHSTPIGL